MDTSDDDNERLYHLNIEFSVDNANLYNNLMQLDKILGVSYGAKIYEKLKELYITIYNVDDDHVLAFEDEHI